MSDALKGWAHVPELPIGVAPLWQWPPRPLAVLKWYWDGWFFVTVKLILVGIAVVTWYWLTPPLSTFETFHLGWISTLFLRNLAILLVVAGGLHVWFYRYSGQADALKFDPRPLGKGRLFTMNTQVADNMFWSCTSGVATWTAYEVLMLWAISNGHIGFLGFADNPIWFLAIFFLIPIWESFYFYWIHRLLHWPPLYRLAHSVHHRNTNIGPWSGLSMHPIEHAIYFGSVLVHFAFASHPLHIIFHLQFYALTAVTTHTGFEAIFLRNKKRLRLGMFHHQMHHRYFECNYGNLDVPWDKFFGSFHDGTAKAHEIMKERRRRFHGT